MASKIYDLHVDSDLDLPELRTAGSGSDADIVIRQGRVAEPVDPDRGALTTYIDGEPGRLWLNMPNSVRLEITGGHRITYERYPGAADDEVRLFLLGSGVGAIMMQRGHVLIHGNAVVIPGREGAVVCIGDSGAGKSTTAVAMMRRGWQVLSDDVCPLTGDDAILPGTGHARLWQDAAQRLGIDTGDLRRTRGEDAKFIVPLGRAHCATSQPVRAFYWLVPDEVDRVSVQRVQGFEAFRVLRNNAYRPEYLRVLGVEAHYLRRLAALGARIPVFRISRPTEGFDVDGLVDAIVANEGSPQACS